MLLHYPGHWRHYRALGIRIHYGSHNEPKHLKGYTHFAEHLMFSGTKELSPASLIKAFHDITDGVEATTSRQNVYIWTHFHAHDFQAVDHLISQMLFHWECPEEDIDMQKEILQDEWQDFHDTEERLILEKIHNLIKIESPNPMGTQSFVENIGITTIKKAKNHWEKNVLTAPRSVLAVGGYSKDELQQLEKRFSLSSSEQKQATAWQGSSCKFLIDKNIAGYIYTENAPHPLCILLDRIFYWRWQKTNSVYFYRMYSLRETTGFFFYDPDSLSIKAIKEFFEHPISEEEFLYAKRMLLQYWDGVLDLIDIRDSMYWLNDFDESRYGMWDIKNPLDAYSYFQQATYSDMTTFHELLRI